MGEREIHPAAYPGVADGSLSGWHVSSADGNGRYGEGRPLAAVPGSPCASMPIGEPRKVPRDSRRQDIGVASPSPAPSCFA